MLGLRSQAFCHTKVNNPRKNKTISMIKAEQRLTGPLVVIKSCVLPRRWVKHNNSIVCSCEDSRTHVIIHKLQVAKDVPSISIPSNSGTCMVRKWHSPVC